jgi:hypothetical protein
MKLWTEFLIVADIRIGLVIEMLFVEASIFCESECAAAEAGEA